VATPTPFLILLGDNNSSNSNNNNAGTKIKGRTGMPVPPRQTSSRGQKHRLNMGAEADGHLLQTEGLPIKTGVVEGRLMECGAHPARRVSAEGGEAKTGTGKFKFKQFFVFRSIS